LIREDPFYRLFQRPIWKSLPDGRQAVNSNLLTYAFADEKFVGSALLTIVCFIGNVFDHQNQDVDLYMGFQ
jgi:hypothetical protein